MIISKLVEQLLAIKEKEGDIEVTCTGSGSPDDGDEAILPKVFETTVENLQVGEHTKIGKRVRLYL